MEVPWLAWTHELQYIPYWFVLVCAAFPQTKNINMRPKERATYQPLLPPLSSSPNQVIYQIDVYQLRVYQLEFYHF
jgi:hypothetical protein